MRVLIEKHEDRQVSAVSLFSIEAWFVAILIVAKYFVEKEVYAVAAVGFGVIAIFLFLRDFGSSFLKWVWALLGLALVGGIQCAGNEARDILRDAAFALSAVSLFGVGYAIGNRWLGWLMVIRIMVLGALAVAGFHLSEFVRSPGLLDAGVNELRDQVSFKTVTLVVIALCFLLFTHRMTGHRIFYPLLEKIIFIPILGASAFLSLSRTGLLIMTMMVLSLLGWLGRLRLKVVFMLGLIGVGFWFLIISGAQTETDTFRGKFVRSLSEVAIADYILEKDVNENWRGFETHQILETYKKGSWAQKIIGQGFGALVDLGFFMNLGGEEMRHIPVFHNGYAYVLLKTGFVGLLFYFLFFTCILRKAWFALDSDDVEKIFLARLLIGVTLSSIAIMYVVGGMAQLNGAEFVILMGCLVRSCENYDVQTGEGAVQK